MERAEEMGVVGWRQVDGLRRPRLRAQQVAPVEGRTGCDRPRRAVRQRTLHHEARRRRLALRADWAGGRPATRALRAGGIAGAKPALPPAVEPGAQVLEARRQRARAHGGSAVSIHPDDVPADGALSVRCDEPLEPVAHGAAARVFRRDQPGAGRREGDRQYRLDHGLDPAWPHPRQGVGDAAAAALHHRRPHGPPRGHAVSLGLPGADHRRRRQRAHGPRRGSQRVDPRGEGVRLQRGEGLMSEPMGFFTDTTVCIGCKACEVACKEWNQLPAANGGVRPLSGDSYDNTRHLDGIHWRHVKFIEQFSADRRQGRWLMMSDVCKHCVHAGCLEVCPTGAIIRTEFDTVVIQSDACNGCRDCIGACPFGVIDINPVSGTAQKCTLCYDRMKVGLEPACAKACPTQSINFGTIADLKTMAQARLGQLERSGESGAYLYGADEGMLGGLNSFYLLVDKPEVYALPPDPQLPSRNLKSSAVWSVLGAVIIALTSLFSFRSRGRGDA